MSVYLLLAAAAAAFAAGFLLGRREKKILNGSRRFSTLLENIEAYDGTARGQKKL